MTRSIVIASVSILAAVAAAVMVFDHSLPDPARSYGEEARLQSPPRQPIKRVFLSGHSLMDQPFPAYLAKLSAAARSPIQWNRQYLPGSSIKDRTRGADATGWSGYTKGVDWDDRPIDPLHEIWRPTAADGPYDTLIVTEQNSLLENIVWNDTIRYLRDYHERIVGLNPGAQTFLFESWLTVSDLAAPARWIAYEKAAEPVWACTAKRINISLAAEGRSDRIRPLPVALSLATLVEAATGSNAVPGISAATTSATMARLFRDDVHLTAAGSYYIALASFTLLHGRPATGLWAPSGMSNATAEALQDQAWRFAADYAESARPMTLPQCRDYIGTTFVPLYLAYQRDTNWSLGGKFRAYAKWARYRFEWARLFRRKRLANPFYFDAEADADYWFHHNRAR